MKTTKFVCLIALTFAAIAASSVPTGASFGSQLVSLQGGGGPPRPTVLQGGGGPPRPTVRQGGGGPPRPTVL
jgi:hypothetical protein